MLKTLKNRLPLIALVSMGALSVGMVVAVLSATDAFTPPREEVASKLPQAAKTSAVLRLVNQPAANRSAALSALAQQKDTEGDRARYLLATDLIEQGEGSSALVLLDKLDGSYKALYPYILLKQGEAEAAVGQAEAAKTTWIKLTQQHPGSAAAAEALYQLGNQPGYPLAAAQLNTLLQNFPSHPRSVEVAFKQLAAADQPGAEATPDLDFDRLALLKLIAHHGIHHPDYVQMLDRLTNQYGSALTPEDWSAIGFGYWETQNYGQAGEAYSKAPATPLSQYRAARGQERKGKVVAAIATYRLLNQTFPDAPETATGLLNLAQLLPKPAAIATLDQVIARFPDQAAEALAQRADLLDALKSGDSANQARASILSQHSSSVAAAKIRLSKAEASAAAGNYPAAIDWAQQLIAAAPEDELAAQAGFWLGKWALLQNQPEIARPAFEEVIRTHSESYFAWRSAVHLDWNVGDFDTIRSLDAQIALPPERSPLPVGSVALQELYLLGQDQTAWAQWQTEFVDQQLPTVAEQLTDGILRLGVGDNLNGIFMASSLAWRDLPEDKQEYHDLRDNSSYWQAVYPFPFSQLITSWAQQRGLNPLLVTALVRQESRFQPDIQSVVGAVGLMQVMPETAAWISEQLGGESYILDQPEDNVKFGTWYLDFTHQEYTNNSLFAVASYNAGPGSVATWIAEGGYANADEFVEKIPYPETKNYVESVFGGYWNYLRLYNPEIAAKVAQL